MATARAERDAATAALRGASSTPFWLDSPAAPEARPPTGGRATADLVVVGGGLTGLWAALRAAERSPGRQIVLLESRRLAWAASGRNGGFCDASLTHGLANGLAHFPSELATLERLGAENLAGIAATVEAEEIDCGFRLGATIDVATAPWQLVGLVEAERLARAHALGPAPELLDATGVRALVQSPTYHGGLRHDGRAALVDPARLAWGLAEAAERRGVVICEDSPVSHIDGERVPLRLHTPHGVVRAAKVLLATSAFRSLVPKVRRRVIPVYDYVLVTEPLAAVQLDAIGWRGREGLADAGNRFHYYRLTDDDRILFGGYDALYHFPGRVDESRFQRPATFALLYRHLLETFPVLEGIAISHAWGGAIDTSSRFCAFFASARRGRIASATGFTGLGVGASRFGADVLLDLVDQVPSERAGLGLVRSLPLPFPPEPLRSAVVAATRSSIERADEHDGRRNAWLRLLDRFGVGFNS